MAEAFCVNQSIVFTTTFVSAFIFSTFKHHSLQYLIEFTF